MFYVCSMLTNMQSPLLKPASKSQSVSCTVNEAEMQVALNEEEVKIKLSVTSSIRKRVELATKDQANCALWYQCHAVWLTSSNFGRIFKRKSNHESLAKELMLLNQRKISAAPVQWGLRMSL